MCRELKLTILVPLRFLQRAWFSVKTDTTITYFRHAGFSFDIAIGSGVIEQREESDDDYILEGIWFIIYFMYFMYKNIIYNVF